MGFAAPMAIAALVLLSALGVVTLPGPWPAPSGPQPPHPDGPKPVPNQPPHLAFALNATTVPTLVPVELNGTLSRDAEGPVASYHWTIRQGRTDGPVLVTYDGAIARHTFATAGTYYVHLQISDSEGTVVASGPFEAKVLTVVNRLPSVDFSADPPQARAKAPINLTANASDADGVIVAYHWRVRQGQGANATQLATGTGPTWQYTFEAPGRYEVELTVVDEQQGTSVRMRPLDVA